MADIQKIADDLSNLTVLEASELTKILEDKWGVSAAAPVAVAAVPPAVAVAPVAAVVGRLSLPLGNGDGGSGSSNSGKDHKNY